MGEGESFNQNVKLFVFNFSPGIELSLEWVEEKVSRLFGKQPAKDPEDPAALVGSFKRYK